MEFYGVLMPILWPFTAKMGFKYQTCSGTKAHWHVPSRQELLGHVQQPSSRRLRSDFFAETPLRTAVDGWVVPSREDDGGACSKATSTPPAPLYTAHRRSAAAAGFVAASPPRAGRWSLESSRSRHFPLIYLNP
jgi:hypothetical protein